MSSLRCSDLAAAAAATRWHSNRGGPAAAAQDARERTATCNVLVVDKQVSDVLSTINNKHCVTPSGRHQGEGLYEFFVIRLRRVVNNHRRASNPNK